MKFDEIKAYFKDEIVQSRLDRPDQELSSARYLFPDLKRGFENEVYVLSAKDFKADRLPDGICSLLVIGNTKQTLPEEGEFNYLLLSGKMSVFDCLNRLSDLFEKEVRFQKSEIFLDRVRALSRANKYDFNEITEIIYELLGNPFSILDMKGDIINYRHIYDVNQYLSGFLKRGEEVEMSEEGETVSKLVAESSSPVMLEELLGEPMRHVINKITISGKVVAFFFVAEVNSRLSEKDFPLIEMICQWIGGELKKNSDLFEASHFAAEHFLTDILDDNYGTDEEFHTRAQLLKFGEKPFHYLAVASLDEMRSRKLNLDSVRAGLKNLIPGAFLLTYKDSIVLYLNTENKDYLDEEKKKEVEAFCKKLQIRVGISYVYSDLRLSHHEYILAKEALQIGGRLHPEKLVFEYQDYMLYHITKMVRSSDDVKRFCHPKLTELIRYDEEHNTEYAYTLYVLLLSAGKKVVAAEELHVHRSTLLYRLEKIDEITGGIDFYDTPTVARLYLSFALLIERGILDSKEYSKL